LQLEQEAVAVAAADLLEQYMEQTADTALRISLSGSRHPNYLELSP
jgi:hypothetical protein